MVTDRSSRKSTTPRPLQVAPYGAWRSPITARLMAESGIVLGGLQAAAGQLFWVEMRPLEEGRSVLVRPGWLPAR